MLSTRRPARDEPGGLNDGTEQNHARPTTPRPRTRPTLQPTEAPALHQTSDPPFSKFTRQAGRVLESVTKGYYGFAQVDQTWAPDVNLYETEAGYRVCVDISGVDKEKIDLTVHEQMLTIRGERPVPRSPLAGASRVRVHRMEIDHGPFAREVELPADVDQEQITATYRNGLLWVELPKRG